MARAMCSAMMTGTKNTLLDDADLDFSMEAMTSVAPRIGRLVRDGETRFLVRRNTMKGPVTVARCATRIMAEARALAGDVIEEVAA